MQLNRRLERAIRSQFGRPTGILGRIAGWFMAHRSSNRVRNLWAVSLLDVRPEDRVLEIGFGPGVAIAELSRRASEGHVCGLDHSAVMVRYAAKRNAKEVARGHVELRVGSAENLCEFERPFDKILAVNAMRFWDRPVERATALRRLLRPGGQIALAFQPRGSGASDAAARERGERVALALRDAGFSNVRFATLGLKPAVVCSLGLNPSGAEPSPHAAARASRSAGSNGP